jgi:hypothetical protein
MGDNEDLWVVDDPVAEYEFVYAQRGDLNG